MMVLYEYIPGLLFQSLSSAGVPYLPLKQLGSVEGLLIPRIIYISWGTVSAIETVRLR